MNAEIQVFCAKAIGRRLLTIEQCDIVISETRGGATLQGVFATLAVRGHEVDQLALTELSREVRSSIAEGMAASQASDQTPKRKRTIGRRRAVRGRTLFERASGAGESAGSTVQPSEPIVERAAAVSDAGAGQPQTSAGRKSSQRKMTHSAAASRVQEPTPAEPQAAARRKIVPVEDDTQADAEQPRPEKRRRGWLRRPGRAKRGADEALRVPDESKNGVVEEVPAKSKARGLRAIVPMDAVDQESEASSAGDGPVFDPGKAAQGAAASGESMLDLSKEHPKFPFWSYESVFDSVCECYMRLFDPEKVAAELTKVRGLHANASMVEALRREAAEEASKRADVDLRRKWMWRHKKPTTNNLVREYMFLVRGQDFMQAKRELGEEIESLLETVAADRLLLAVNDALGRSDVEWHAVLELVAYHQAGLRLQEMARPLAEREGLSAEDFLMRVAKAVSAHSRGSADNARTCAAWWLKRGAEEITTDDMEYLSSLLASNLVLR